MSDKSDNARNFILVTDSSKAEAYIAEAIKRQASAIIWAKNQETTINSRIISSDTADNFIMTEPADLTEGEVYFSVSLSTANIFFKTIFISRDQRGLKFQKPTQIFEVQRRSTFRISVASRPEFIVEFSLPDNPTGRMKEKILDLSAGGMAFVIDEKENPLFHTNMLLTNLTFKLHDHTIRADGQIRYIHYSHHSKIGILFKNLSEGDIRKIAAFVFEESRKYFSKFI